ncbi:MAG: tyrosine-type recombinase/integrase [Rhizonema sp. NSF051]|nr:tyrosine-type recombinase/integrase [Rhizonema sp. NSF051]
MTRSLVQLSHYRASIAELPTPAAEAKLVALWLNGLAPSSVRAYQCYIKRLKAFLGKKPLKSVTYEDLVEYGTTFTRHKESTRRIHLAAVKSLISFAHKIGYLPFNIGMALKLGEMPDAINERYIDEADVKLLVRAAQKLCSQASTPKRLEIARRNVLIVKLLYAAGLRAHELCQLTWSDLTARGDSGQVYVHEGKGNKSRSILLKPKLWSELMAFKGDSVKSYDAVFTSQKGGHLERQNLHPIIKAVVQEAGLDEKISCHWLRHAHGSHAVERKVNPVLIRDTLGHSDLSVTDRYLRARPHESSALELIDL